MNQVSELRRRAEALASELADIREEIQRTEEDRFVQIQFHGHAKRYTYELAPAHEAMVGDYVAVYSPHTDQFELVRVVAKGPGAWAQRYSVDRPLKLARQIDWIPR